MDVSRVSNLIVFMSDEHNPLYSGPYGHPFVRTPNMDRLAAEGTVFTNAYCPSPLCVPSRSAFTSGRYVHEVQTYSNCMINVRPDHSSYGKELNEQGVRTCFVGKTHLWTSGEDLGFSDMIVPSPFNAKGDTRFRRKPLFIREGAAKRGDETGPAAVTGNPGLRLDFARTTAERANSLKIRIPDSLLAFK